MAGLVPAIHVLQYLGMAGGYVYILTNRPNGVLDVGVTRSRAVPHHPSAFNSSGNA
jgi:putative endonuclease